ncbi:hypothetical protein [Rhizobium paknamense]|uniref:DUF2946 domain-containing protein n=1 Tax=Rhizobium paknamense TaxID=1206817 RepID=A0ABU0I9Q0_9HYPH|nr:hypothetical protein [Rhizobium paknamense]MDQ0454964.1 hypothetical protein [Rhizobium paknamense]
MKTVVRLLLLLAVLGYAALPVSGMGCGMDVSGHEIQAAMHHDMSAHGETAKPGSAEKTHCGGQGAQMFSGHCALCFLLPATPPMARAGSLLHDAPPPHFSLALLFEKAAPPLPPPRS